VAAVALPVGIAYADLARVPPVIGMYATIFPLFAYALFGLYFAASDYFPRLLETFTEVGNTHLRPFRWA
jgi:Sulfate permease family